MSEQYFYDDSSDSLTIKKTEDLSPILKQVKAAKEVNCYIDGVGYYAGTIPGIIIEQYMKEHGISYYEIINNNVHIHRILNDPDYSKFRVWEGRV